MQHRFVWASALALALTGSSLLEARAGVILISTRKNQDTAFSTEYVSDEKGPGQVTPGDIAMADLLGDHGYSCRVLIDALLNPNALEPGGHPEQYLQPVNAEMKVDLVIWSGSSASADIPAPPPGIPLMMGEHVTLGNRVDRLGSVFMYNGTSSNDPNEASTPPASKYLKVLVPDHPIFKGLPLDAQGRIKIFREPYPAEESKVPTGGKKNFEYRWCTQAVADAAAGTTVLAVLEGAEDRACLAVVEKGGMLANSEAASARMVHMFVNENGSGGSRRVFLALTGWGRLVFLRAAKWALGETIEPYQPLKILEVKPAGAQQVNLSWAGSARSAYRIHASADLANWQTVVEDVLGVDGVVTSRLDMSGAPNPVFLRVSAIP